MTVKTSATAPPNSFRTQHRRSNLRANIFLLECVAVAATYLHVLYRNVPHATNAPSLRTHVLAVFGLLYMTRLNVMARYLLPRELAVEELTFVVLVWLPSIMGSFAFLRDKGSHSSPSTLIASTVLYLTGSYLNSYSELQRKWWKEDAKNKGRCYTIGLFSMSRNINYFGDTVLFAGWAMATGNAYNVWVPLVMGLSFWFHHIPDKEAYLAQRYRREWNDYKAATPYAFIPYIC